MERIGFPQETIPQEKQTTEVDVSPEAIEAAAAYNNAAQFARKEAGVMREFAERASDYREVEHYNELAREYDLVGNYCEEAAHFAMVGDMAKANECSEKAANITGLLNIKMRELELSEHPTKPSETTMSTSANVQSTNSRETTTVPDFTAAEVETETGELIGVDVDTENNTGNVIAAGLTATVVVATGIALVMRRINKWRNRHAPQTPQAESFSVVNGEDQNEPVAVEEPIEPAEEN